MRARTIVAACSLVGALACTKTLDSGGLEDQIKSLLADRGGDVARRAQEFANEAQGRAGEWLDKSREIFEEQTQRLMSAFEAGRDAMREEIRRGSTESRG